MGSVKENMHIQDLTWRIKSRAAYTKATPHGPIYDTSALEERSDEYLGIRTFDLTPWLAALDIICSDGDKMVSITSYISEQSSITQWQAFKKCTAGTGFGAES